MSDNLNLIFLEPSAIHVYEISLNEELAVKLLCSNIILMH